MRNGDFRGLLDSQGRLTTLYDPNTTDPTTYARQPLSYNGLANVIDPSRITKLAKFIFAATPLPNQPRRLPERCRYIQSPLAKSYRGVDVGPHALSHHDQRGTVECVARLPVA